ncbi:hypothetical protein CUZ56_00614 [Saezia sanguinis]|uniref:Uncharacterized protein n=1 Tax=Saezia sanguinis TaxID=1965230 RepID=A0A433SH98_9BURK|nr:hypothetical protein CUZ56_00614 [Saezia sanguinis]
MNRITCYVLLIVHSNTGNLQVYNCVAYIIRYRFLAVIECIHHLTTSDYVCVLYPATQSELGVYLWL